MCGQRRANVDAVKKGLHLLGGNPAFLQAPYGVPNGFRPWLPAPFFLTGAIDAHDFLLLGGIEQLKKNGKRPQQFLHGGHIGEFRHGFQKLRGRVGIVGGLVGRFDQAMGKARQILTFLLVQHIGKQTVKQQNVARQGFGKVGFVRRKP